MNLRSYFGHHGNACDSIDRPCSSPHVQTPRQGVCCLSTQTTACYHASTTLILKRQRHAVLNRDVASCFGNVRIDVEAALDGDGQIAPSSSQHFDIDVCKEHCRLLVGFDEYFA